MSDQRKILIAICASIVLHCFFLLLLAGWAALFPASASANQTEPPAERPIEMTLVAKPAPPPKPKVAEAPKELIQMDSNGLHESATPPPAPVFESDKNMQAASENPSTGLLPMPSQEGHDLPFVGFKKQLYTPGKPGQPPASTGARASQPQSERPYPVTEVKKATKPSRSEAKPEETTTPAPVPTPRPAHPPLKTTPDGSLAFRAGTPAPSPTPTAEPSPTPSAQPSPTVEEKNTPIETPTPQKQASAAQTPTQMAMLTTPAPASEARPPATGYQPDSEETRIEGSISNRGKAAVNAISTPRGRYTKVISDMIGSRWEFYTKWNLEKFTPGEVHIRFFIDAKGSVKDATVVSNSSNKSLAETSLDSIYQSNFPPLPPELDAYLTDGLYEVDFNFILYSLE